MTLVRSLLAVAAFVFPSACKPIRARGSDSIAPYGNETSISTSSNNVVVVASTAASTSTTAVLTPSSWTSSSPIPSPYAGLGTGASILTTTAASGGFARPTDQGTVSIGFTTRQNGTGPPCTVNVPSATVDWWFAATYDWAKGTLTPLSGNYTQAMLSYAPNTDTFDVASALATDYAYTESLSYDAEWDFTFTWDEPYTVTPSATITSVITISSAQPLPSDIIPASDYDLYNVDQPPASIAITGATGTVFAATSTTPFIYFSVYEVETAVPIARENGTVRSSTTTQTFSLTDPFVLPTWIDGIEDSSIVTGNVPTEFLQQIPQSLCAPGTYQADVTVVFVVEYYYIDVPSAQPMVVHIESSVLGFDDPGATPTSDDVHAQETGDSGGDPFEWQFPDPGTSTAFVNTVGVLSTVDGSAFSVMNGSPQVSDNVQAQSQPTSGPQNAAGSVGQGPNPAEPTSQTVGTIGTLPIVVAPSSVVIVGSQTLKPGQPAITVGGVQVSLAPSATAIIVGGKTSALPPVVTSPANPLPPPVLTIGSSTLTGNAATQFFISPGQTLTPGGSATVDGTVVSLGPSASFLVVGGSTQILPTAAPAATTPPEIVVGGATFTANPGSSFIIKGQTLAPGQVITVDGTSISLAPSASFAVIQGSTQTFPSVTSVPEIVVGGSTIIANSGSSFVIDGQTLAPNQQITVSGTTLSLGPSASFVVVNGVTSVLPVVTPPPEIVVGGSTFIATSGSTFVIDGQTLTPGQQITVSGTTLSLGPSASFVVFNGATSAITNPAAQITPPPLTIGNGVFTANPGSGTTYIVDGSTLTPGGQITVSGTTISLAAGASALIINGQTTLLNPQGSPITNAPLLTIGSQTYTAVSGTTFVIGGQTLTPGGTITVDGTTISLAPGATELIYGTGGQSTTEVLFPATTTRSQSITGTNSPSAGATGLSGGAKATGTGKKGAASTIKPSGLEGWLLSGIIAFAGLILG